MAFCSAVEIVAQPPDDLGGAGAASSPANSCLIFGIISKQEMTVEQSMKHQSALQPRASVINGTAICPMAATNEPEPLMRPTTVPKADLEPLMDGCSAKSAATADVTMLFGPPIRMPMQASMTINVKVFSVSANNAMIINNGHKISKNTTMTQPRRPPIASETTPTIIPPGIIPKSYKVEIMFAVSGSKCVCRKRGSQKNNT